VKEEFVFAGFGGQGVMFAGQILAYTAMDEGLEVTWIPSYGPEMRGGTANCVVVISDKPVGSPLVSRPKTAVVFNPPSFDRYEPLVAAGGLLVYNVSLIERPPQRQDIALLPVPALALADALGDLRLMNVVMLGALLTARPVLPLDALRRALQTHLPARRQDMLAQNLAALEQGAAYAAAQAPA
jgi:2-oxoglutarate ferredoxin oxidoreductase subunit gamma